MPASRIQLPRNFHLRRYLNRFRALTGTDVIATFPRSSVHNVAIDISCLRSYMTDSLQGHVPVWLDKHPNYYKISIL